MRINKHEMKLISKVAHECGLKSHYIYNVIRKEKMIVCGMYLNKLQEDKIHQILYFEGKITEITLESKLNNDVHP